MNLITELFPDESESSQIEIGLELTDHHLQSSVLETRRYDDRILIFGCLL